MPWRRSIEVYWTAHGEVVIGALRAGSLRTLTSATLVIRSGGDEFSVDTIADVSLVPATEPWVRILRLPPEHTALSIEIRGSQSGRLNVRRVVEKSLEGSPHSSWRLVLQEIPHTPQGSGTPQGAVRTLSLERPGLADFERILRKTIEERSKASQPFWAMASREQHDPNDASIRFVEAAQVVYPRHSDSEVIAVSVEEPMAAHPHEDDPSMPVAWRTAQREVSRVPVMRLETSRTEPDALELQQHVALVHVMHQRIDHALGRDVSLSLGEPTVELLGMEDLEAAGLPHDFAIVPPSSEPIVVQSLAKAIAGPDRHGQPDPAALHFFVEWGTASVEAGGASAEALTVEFSGAALGDDIGLIATRDGVLMPTSRESSPTHILLFRVAHRKLLPSPYVEDAAFVADLRRRAADQQSQEPLVMSQAAPRTGLSRARSQMIEASIAQLRRLGIAARDDEFGACHIGAGPLELLAYLTALERAARQGRTALPGFSQFRQDPSAWGILLDHDGMLRQPVSAAAPAAASLPARVAALAGLAGMLGDGLSPDTELEALALIVDDEWRGMLAKARVTLTREAPIARFREVVRELADTDAVRRLARSLRDRGKAELGPVETYLSDCAAGRWTAFAKAEPICHACAEYRLREDLLRNLLGEAPTTAAPHPTSGRALEEWRRELRGQIEAAAGDARVEPLRDIDLDDLDRDDLAMIEDRLSSLSGRPTRQRLFDAALDSLQSWAEVPDFAALVAKRYWDRAPDQQGPSNREAAARFVDRSHAARRPMPDLPTRGGLDAYRRSLRSAVQDLGKQGFLPEEEVEHILVPFADMLLHHKAYRAIVRTVDAVEGDGPTGKSEAQSLRRALAAWPQTADRCWDITVALAGDTLGQRKREAIERALTPPDLELSLR